MLKTLIIWLLCLSINKQSFSQQSVDGEFLFKTWFFLEKVNESNSYTKYHSKDSSLFEFFLKEVDLKIDTLVTSGFHIDYLFLSVCQFYNDSLVNKNAIVYKGESQKNGYLYTGIPINHCEGYTLAINRVTGRSYRLKGFRGNDFLTLLGDIKMDHKERMKGNKFLKAFRVDKFLKEYKVDGIDFICLYKALNSFKKRNAACLSKCDNITVTIF